MKIVCPSCGQPIPGEDIDIASGRALCKPCGEVVVLAAPAPVALAAPATTGLEVFEAVSGGLTPAFRPSDLKLAETHDGKTATLTVTPSRASAIPILGFAAVWDGFLVFWYTMAFFAAHGGPAGIMFWFPLLHVAAGVFITYAGLTRLLNRTQVRLGADRLEVHQAPLPGKRAAVETSDVLRFEIGSRLATNRRGSSFSQWFVKALTKDGRQLHLPIELPSAEHAAHVAHRLNAALEIARAPLGYRG